MRRRALLTVALLGCLSLLATGCAASEAPARDGNIPIGVNVELTGPASLLGASYKNAVDLIVGDINRQGVLGGRKIELIVRDNKSDPAEATRVAKNLWDNEKIVAMVGPGTSPTSLPVAQEAERRQVPLVSMASSGAVVNPVDQRRYSFKTSPNMATSDRVLVLDHARLLADGPPATVEVDGQVRAAYLGMEPQR